MDETTVAVRGDQFQTRVLRGGSGPPLVVLHGPLGLGGWEVPLDLLAKRHSVAAPELPGFGATTGLEQLDDVVDLAIYHLDLLDALKLGPVDLVGHSVGGLVAAEVAALGGPAYVRRLVLAAPFGLWLDETPTTDYMAMPPREFWPLFWQDPDAPVAQPFTLVPENPRARFEQQLVREQAFAATARFLWPIPDKGLKKRLHRVQAPTLLLWGEQDRIVPPQYGLAFQRRLAHAELELVPNAGHHYPLEQPDDFVAEVERFLG